MIIVLLWKEVREHLMTFRFAAAMITTLVLVLLSFWVQGEDFISRANAYNLAVESSAEENVQVFVPSQISPVIHRAPSVLSVFAQGEDRRFGNSLQVSRWEVPRRAEGSFYDNVLLSSEPTLDLYTIFALVISLFGILFSYDSISGEREKGTLRIQCSASVSRGAIFVSKFFGALFCLAIPILLSVLSGLILFVFLFSTNFSAEHWCAITLMILAGLVYGAFFIAIGLVCSALVRHSSVALILSLLVWTLGVLLIPSAAKNGADLLAPLPSSAELAGIEKTSLQDAAKALEEFRKEYPRYWGGLSTGGWSIPGDGDCYKFDGNEEAYDHGVRWVQTFEPMMQRRAERVWDAFNRSYAVRRRHTGIFSILSLSSPTYHLRNTFTLLAGTGYEVYNQFLENARLYRRKLIDSLKDRGYFSGEAYLFFSRRTASEISHQEFAERVAYYRSQLAAGRDYSEFMDPLTAWGYLKPEEVPRLDIPKAAPDFGAALQSTGILVLMVALLLLAGLIAFNRYDVR